MKGHESRTAATAPLSTRRGGGRTARAACGAPQEPVPVSRRPPREPELQPLAQHLSLLRVRCQGRHDRPRHATPQHVVSRRLPVTGQRNKHHPRHIPAAHADSRQAGKTLRCRTLCTPLRTPLAERRGTHVPLHGATAQPARGQLVPPDLMDRPTRHTLAPDTLF